MQVGDSENVKRVIDDCRNAAMKIGQSMSQGGASSGTDSSSSTNEEKKDWELSIMREKQLFWLTKFINLFNHQILMRKLILGWIYKFQSINRLEWW